MSLSSKALGEDITRDQLELLKAKFDVLQGERKVSLYFILTPLTRRFVSILTRSILLLHTLHILYRLILKTMNKPNEQMKCL